MFLCSQGSSIRKVDRQSSEAVMLLLLLLLLLVFGSRAEFGVLRMRIISVDGAPLSFLHYFEYLSFYY